MKSIEVFWTNWDEVNNHLLYFKKGKNSYGNVV